MKIPLVRTVLLAVASTPLFAHPGGHVGVTASSGAMAMGFLHPITGWDHLVAMVTVGALGASLGGRHRYAVPASFLAALVAGGLVAGAGLPLIGAEWIISGSVLLFGALLALSSVPKALVYGAVLLGALVHGHAHLAEMPVGTDAVAYGLGMLAASAMLHGIGGLTAQAVQRHASADALRRLGGVVAAAGAILVGMVALH